MAQIYLESFNTDTSLTTTKLRWQSSNADALYSGKGRSGTYALGMSGSEATRYDIPGSPLATILTGVSISLYNSSGTPATAPILQIMDGSTVQLYVQADSNHKFSVYNGAGTLLAGPSTVTMDDSSTSVFTYLDLKATIHNTAGSFTLNIYTSGGNQTLSGSSVNTRNSANNQATGVQLHASGGNQTMVYSDWYIADTTGSAPQNDLWGPVKVYAQVPNAAGTTTQWTPSSSTNVSRVNEAAMDSDTGYVSDNTVGHIDTYAFPALTPLAGTVFGEQTTVWAKRDDTTARTFCAERRSSGTNYAGAETFTVTGSYAPYVSAQQTDPAGGSWTISSINAAEVGQKVLS